MVKRLGSIAVVLLLTACGSSITLPVVAPSPSPVGADSAAADLRTHTDLLFGEHTILIGKLAVAATAGRKDEFRAYAGALAANGADVATLIRSALGETVGTQFGRAWTVGDGFLVDYLVASVTHDKTKQDAATTGLTGTYLPQLTGLLTSSLPLSGDQAAQMGTDQVSGLKQIIDDAVTSGFAALYGDLHTAYVKAVRAGDLVSAAIVSRFADRFPGNAQSKSADFRAVLDTLLLNQSFLMTMASHATIAGTAAELSAARGALAQNATSLGTVLGGVFGGASGDRFGHVWDSETALLVAYAKGGDAGVRQNVISTAGPPTDSAGSVFGPDLTAALTASLQAIDDQRASAFDKLGDDDRNAAMVLAAVGDSVTDVGVRQEPSKFL
jgi:hypothetical protein